MLKCSILRKYGGRQCFSWFGIPVYFDNLLDIMSVWHCHGIFSSHNIPRHLEEEIHSISTLFILSIGIRPVVSLLHGWSTVSFFCMFSVSLFTESSHWFPSNSLFSSSLTFDIEVDKEYSTVVNKFLSLAYDINMNDWLDCRVSFLLIKNGKGPRIEPCVTPVVIVFRDDETLLRSIYWLLCEK